MRRARRLGIRHVPPNIVYRDVIGPGDIVADAGCADDADFSKHMIAEHGAVAWGIDPTRKHAAALAQLASRLAGFHYMPAAIAAEAGIITFHESGDNVSGSLLKDHVNVIHDSVQRYEVQALDLQGLASRIGSERIAILKLDLEGAEYELLSHVTSQMLKPFDQIFVEFHHHAVTRYDETDTRAVVHRLEGLGFASFSLDDHNYVFYHEPAAVESNRPRTDR
jgi:FkbM family methyltransferase